MKQKNGAYLGVPLYGFCRLLRQTKDSRTLISRLNREGSAMDEDAAPVKIYGYIVRL